MSTMQALKNAYSLTTVETDFGVTTSGHQATLTSQLPTVERNLVDNDIKFTDNRKQLTGYRGPTKLRATGKEGKLTEQFWLSARVFQAFLARLLQNVTSSAASSAASEVKTITKSGSTTAGEFTVEFRNAVTAVLAHDITAGAMQAALEALPTIGVGNVTVLFASNVWTLTFANDLANVPLPEIKLAVVTPFSGGVTISRATTTQGLAAGIRTHTNRWTDICIPSQPGFEFVQGIGCNGSVQTKILYKGCVVNQIVITIDGNEEITMDVEILTDGSKTRVPGFVFQTSSIDTVDLLGNMVTIAVGDDANDVLAEGEFVSAKITINAGMTVPKRTTKSKNIVAFRYGEDLPGIEVEVVIAGDESHPLALRADAGEFEDYVYFNCLIDPESGESAPQESVQVTASKCKLKAKAGKDGEEPRLTLSLTPVANPTDQGTAVIVNKTRDNGYLTAA